MGQAPPGRREEHPIASVVLLLLGLAIAMGGLHYGWGSLDNPGAGFVPFLAGAAMAGFSGITLVQSLMKGWRPAAEPWSGTRWRRPLIATVCLVLYSVFLRDVGFPVSTFILAAYLYRMLDPPGWTETLVAAALTTFGFYLVFQVWLEVPLPKGLLTFAMVQNPAVSAVLAAC
jgi:putative tricarboxylic transport membrane protein